MNQNDYWKGIDFVDYDYDSIPRFAKSLPNIFDYHIDINKNAYLNWRMDFAGKRRLRFAIFGEAYFDTAYYLLTQCLEDNSDKKADVWIFPILFNTIHGIEVYLKAIHSSYNISLNTGTGNIEGNHDIRQLCSTAKNQILNFRKLHPDSCSDQLFEAIKVVENFIEHIYANSEDMTFARYPMQKNKEDQFYVFPHGNIVVNLEKLNQQLPIIYHMLDFILEMSEMYIENMEIADYS